MDAEGEFESDDMPIYNKKVFPHPFMRIVPWPEGLQGALPDHIAVASTSAARNGRFFTVIDVVRAIKESLNLWQEGSALSPFDLRLNRLAPIESFTEPATIWDLTPPERDPVPTMTRMVACREKVFAFAMGLHPRLGAQVSPQRKVGGQETLRTTHPGGNPGANLKSISHRCHPILSISHRCHPILVAFVWELTNETIDLHLGCLQGGF